jgi:4-amino-4-deoxy-L-arabinose transferase-like glycosyltransferase
MKMPRSFKLYLIPVLILLAVTLPHLEQGDFRRDTVRYAAVGLHMWNDGSLLVPQLNPEKLYFNKPPMAFWIHGFFLKIFGANLPAARLPSVLAAVGVLVFSMLSVRNLGTRREAVVSGIVLALTYEFFRRTREISLDFWQLFFVMLAVWLVTQAIRQERHLLVILCGIPIGLALLCKPLVALFALPIFAIWLLMARRAGLIPWIFLGALPVAILVAAPWHLYMYSTFGACFTNQYFIHEVIDRARGTDQPSSIFFYLAENLRTYWPWMIGLIAAVYFRMRQTRPRPARRDFMMLAAVWVVLWLVALSIFPDRKPNYALPIYPMLAWIVSWGICRISAPALNDWYERGLPWLAPAVIVLFLAATLAPLKFQAPPEKNWLALIAWIKANKIDSAQLAYENIDQNDVCYVYLKTGRWMKSLPAAQASAHSENLRVVKKLFGNTRPSSDDHVLFSAPPVFVIER